MILTFSILGQYLDAKIDLWLHNFWSGNLILACASIALACVVAFVLVKNDADSDQPVAKVEYSSKLIILAFIS